MYLNYDLHTHSTASDGVLSPSELVSRAAAAGIYGLALTDHDTLDGLEEATAAARLHGMILVPGVEISVTWNECSVHIVGLNINAAYPALQTGLAKIREFRTWRAKEIGRRLAEHNIPGAFEGARQLANGDIVSRAHFAKFLVQQGFATDERQVFKHFLIHGKPGYVAGQWATLHDAVQWIQQAGGQAVLAHPARCRLSYHGLRQLIEAFRELGGVALEVTSSNHSQEDSLNMAKLAREFGLLSSVGSDFHDPQTARFDIGQVPQLPNGCIPIWQDWV